MPRKASTVNAILLLTYLQLLTCSEKYLNCEVTIMWKLAPVDKHECASSVNAYTSDMCFKSVTASY